MNPTRRTVVTALATFTGALTLSRSGLALALPGQTPAAKGGLDLLSGSAQYPTKLSPFAMSEVRLLPGEFATQTEINQRYLDSLDTDRLLHSFRVTLG